jgi:hypothetical protein
MDANQYQIYFTRFSVDPQLPYLVEIRLVFTDLDYNMVRFQVLTAASTNMAVFWDVAPCNLVEIDQRFRSYADGGSKHF